MFKDLQYAARSLARQGCSSRFPLSHFNAPLFQRHGFEMNGRRHDSGCGRFLFFALGFLKALLPRPNLWAASSITNTHHGYNRKDAEEYYMGIFVPGSQTPVSQRGRGFHGWFLVNHFNIYNVTSEPTSASTTGRG